MRAEGAAVGRDGRGEVTRRKRERRATVRKATFNRAAAPVDARSACGDVPIGSLCVREGVVHRVSLMALRGVRRGQLLFASGLRKAAPCDARIQTDGPIISPHRSGFGAAAGRITMFLSRGERKKLKHQTPRGPAVRDLGQVDKATSGAGESRATAAILSGEGAQLLG